VLDTVLAIVVTRKSFCFEAAASELTFAADDIFVISAYRADGGMVGMSVRYQNEISGDRQRTDTE
jgi:hypothetical protein